MKNYKFTDIEKMFKGSDELHKMENMLERFSEIIRGIILSKKFKSGRILINRTDMINSKLSIRMGINAPKNKPDIYVRVFSTHGEHLLKSLPKELVPVLFVSTPQILSVLIKNNPELKKDIEFLMSMAPDNTP